MATASAEDEIQGCSGVNSLKNDHTLSPRFIVHYFGPEPHHHLCTATHKASAKGLERPGGTEQRLHVVRGRRHQILLHRLLRPETERLEGSLLLQDLTDAHRGELTVLGAVWLNAAPGGRRTERR